MVPSDLHALGSAVLPDLRDTEIALVSAAGIGHAARRLREHVVASLERTAR